MAKQYHIGLEEGQAGRYVLLPGDPGRCEKIARYFDEPRLAAQNREYTTYTGYLNGEKVSVTSTGIGGPSAAIAIEELAAIGADTFIRVGTCGGIDLEVCGGDIVLASGAVRQEGTSREYAPLEYPALADFSVLSALAETASELGCRHHIGVVQSKDSFYGQHASERMPVSAELTAKWNAWKRLGVLASEMEAASLYVAATVLKVRCGACFSVVWNQERRLAGMPDEHCHETEKAVKLAVEALKKMIEKTN